MSFYIGLHLLKCTRCEYRRKRGGAGVPCYEVFQRERGDENPGDGDAAIVCILYEEGHHLQLRLIKYDPNHHLPHVPLS